MAPSACAHDILLCSEDDVDLLSTADEEVQEEEENDEGGREEAEAQSDSPQRLLEASWQQLAPDWPDQLSALMEREASFMPEPEYVDLLHRKIADAAQCRHRAISWLYKARSLHKFHHLTAALSVNYLDRFLSRHQHLQNGKAWIMQLVSVACLSLAAKVEETEVPLLVDLQIGDPEYVFEARTVQRMELMVLSTLGWRMSSVVTPLSFAPHLLQITFDILSSSFQTTNSVTRILFYSHLQYLIFTALLQDARFVEHRPSSIAAAAALCATQELFPLQFALYKKAFLLRISPFAFHHEEIERCARLMVDLNLSSVDGSNAATDQLQKHQQEGCCESYNIVPNSPAGVLDASFSCTSSSSGGAGTSTSDGEISTINNTKNLAMSTTTSPAGPAPKKRKLFTH